MAKILPLALSMVAAIGVLGSSSAATLSASSPSLAPADTYPKNFDIDVLHYRFELALSDESDRIEGAATLAVRFLADGVEAFELDLVGTASGSSSGMLVVNVTRAGSTPPVVAPERLSFSHSTDRLRIALATPSRRGEIRRFRIAYAGVPQTGLVIGPNKHGDRSFFSDNWPNKARHWLPTVDHPYDKATSEMIVTAPNHYQVISNGLLVEQTDLAGDELERVRSAAAMPGASFRRTHWRQSVPIATWLYVLGVARFAVQEYDTFDGKALQTWVYAQDRDAGFYDFAEPTKQVLQYYSDTIGPYAYEKLANVQSNSVGGGMEAATAIFYGDNSVTGDRSVRWRNVIIHEIAHQWWGNAVTEDDWDHVWLSEGFATYFTLLFRDYAYGRDDFLEGLTGARQRIIDFYADNWDYRVVHDNLDDMGQVTTGMTYQKGAWFLHMLRGRMGDDRFWQGIRDYYRLYMNGNASTDDFREVMESASEPMVDLTSFFDQWLYQGGYPKLRGRWEWDAGAGELVIELEQLQETYAFELTIPAVIHIASSPDAGARGARTGAGGDRQTISRELLLSAASTRIRIALDREPSDVVLDPDTWVLMEVDFHKR